MQYEVVTEHELASLSDVLSDVSYLLDKRVVLRGVGGVFLSNNDVDIVTPPMNQSSEIIKNIRERINLYIGGLADKDDSRQLDVTMAVLLAHQPVNKWKSFLSRYNNHPEYIPCRVRSVIWARFLISPVTTISVRQIPMPLTADGYIRDVIRKYSVIDSGLERSDDEYYCTAVLHRLINSTVDDAMEVVMTMVCVCALLIRVFPCHHGTKPCDLCIEYAASKSYAVYNQIATLRTSSVSEIASTLSLDKWNILERLNKLYATPSTVVSSVMGMRSRTVRSPFDGVMTIAAFLTRLISVSFSLLPANVMLCIVNKSMLLEQSEIVKNVMDHVVGVMSKIAAKDVASYYDSVVHVLSTQRLPLSINI